MPACTCTHEFQDRTGSNQHSVRISCANKTCKKVLAIIHTDCDEEELLRALVTWRRSKARAQGRAKARADKEQRKNVDKTSTAGPKKNVDEEETDTPDVDGFEVVDDTRGARGKAADRISLSINGEVLIWT